MVGLPDSEKNRLDTIPACDRQTDGQTSCHGIVSAMHTRRAVKTVANGSIVFFTIDQIAGLASDAGRLCKSSVYSQLTRVTDRRTDGKVISVAERSLLHNAR